MTNPKTTVGLLGAVVLVGRRRRRRGRRRLRTRVQRRAAGSRLAAVAAAGRGLHVADRVLHRGEGERDDQGRLRVHRLPLRSERHVRGRLVHGPGPFGPVRTITGGTGDWAGATGHIRTHGTFTLAEGGNSDYEGLISR